MPSRPSFAVQLGAVALLSIGCVIGIAAPASAHNYLVSSTPEAGSTLTELPDEFAITTNDALLELGAAAGGFVMQVVGSDGLYYGDGCVSVSGASMTAAPALGPAGEYTLAWQVVSADGHSVSDELVFNWAPSADAALSEGSTTAPVCGEATTEATTQGATQGATPSPSAEATAEATPEPEKSATADARRGDSEPASVELGDVLWIGGGLVALIAAVLVTLAVIRRRQH